MLSRFPGTYVPSCHLACSNCHAYFPSKAGTRHLNPAAFSQKSPLSHLLGPCFRWKTHTLLSSCRAEMASLDDEGCAQGPGLAPPSGSLASGAREVSAVASDHRGKARLPLIRDQDPGPGSCPVNTLP